jgi:hypothetical protein
MNLYRAVLFIILYIQNFDVWFELESEMGKAFTQIQCLNAVGIAQSSTWTCTFKIVIKMPIIWSNKQQAETGKLFIWEVSLMKANLQNRTIKNLQ